MSKSQHTHTFKFTSRVDELLTNLASTRFGANKTAALRAAIVIAARIYEEPATVSAADPETALHLYVEAQASTGKISGGNRPIPYEGVVVTE